jgi:uncharacterized protein
MGSAAACIPSAVRHRTGKPPMFVVTISGPVVVTDDATDKPITDPERLATFDGLNSGRETCSKYHHGTVADLELKDGLVRLVFDAAKKKLRVVSSFDSRRKLTKKELAELIDDTSGQWSDGIGEGCFDTVMEKRKVFIDLSPDNGGKMTATQVEDDRPVPKASAANALTANLVKAAGAGDFPKVKELVAAKAKLDGRGQHGYTPLTAAISGDHLEVALYLIEQGADVSLKDKNGTDPLRWAAIRSGWVMKHQNVRLATLLLDKGAAVDTRDKNGFTPLIWAANRGAVKLVELLIARGVDVNAKTTQKHNAGRTALYMARNIDVVRVLLAAGADPNALTEDGGPIWEQQTPAAAKLLKEAAGK